MSSPLQANTFIRTRHCIDNPPKLAIGHLSTSALPLYRCVWKSLGPCISSDKCHGHLVDWLESLVSVHHIIGNRSTDLGDTSVVGNINKFCVRALVSRRAAGTLLQ